MSHPLELHGRSSRAARVPILSVAAIAFVLQSNFGLAPLCAQTANVTVNANNTLAVMPDTGIALHTSVYANIFGAPQLPAEIAASGVQMLRFPGGNYASIYHWSNHTATDGYAASASHFGNFVDRLMDGSGARAMVTVNYGASMQNSLGGQPQEAAAWVAYANGDASLYGTPNDIPLGIDAGGNNWRTVGYWARLRGLTAAQNPDEQYDFLAIDHDAPLGIKYWEIGNELNGNGYYTDFDINWGWQNDRHVGYENPVDTDPGNPNEPLYYPGRANNPALSPAAYGTNFNQFAAAMKAVDPTIKVGGVLVGPGGVGDVADPARNWDRNVLSVAGANMDFGIIHWYVNNGSSTNNLLNATDDLPALFANVRNRIDTYVGAGESQRIELHMTEFGYFGTVANEQIDGVFAANTYATALADGVKSVDWLELSKNSFVGDNPSELVRGGAFYGIQVFSHIAEPGSEFVGTTSSNGNVEVHSTVLPDGRVGLLIANLNSSGSSTVNMNISGVTLDVSGTTWLYGQNQTTPLQSELATGLGNAFAMSVPFRSIVALLIDTILPGDFNHDGTVDAADYVVWRKTDGTPGGYETWRAHFGNTTSSSAAAAIAVPEPRTWMLFGVGIAMLLSGRAPRRRFESE